MNSLLQDSGFWFPLILSIIALAGFFVEIRGIAVPRKKSKPESATVNKKNVVTLMQNLVVPFLFILIIACSVWLYIASGASNRSETESVEASIPEPTPSATIAAATEEPSSTPFEIQRTSSWLDEFPPMIKKPKNFFFGSWGDGTEFSLDDRTYTHGVGLRICGTQFEGSVPAADAPYKTDRYDCRQVYSEFALRSEYASLTFSIGADNGDLAHYGSDEKNGVAQVLIVDSDRGNTLFDTGWVNYSYAKYDVALSLLNVENLKIIFRTSGIPHKSPANRLQFVIVNPVLKLVED